MQRANLFRLSNALQPPASHFRSKPHGTLAC
jgi:hypothetical protein